MKAHLDPRQPSPSPSRPSTSSRSSKAVSDTDRRDPEAGHLHELPVSDERPSRRRGNSPSHISELLEPPQPPVDPSRTLSRLPANHGGHTLLLNGLQEGNSKDTLAKSRGKPSSQPVAAVFKGLSEGMSALSIASFTKRSWNKRITLAMGRKVAEQTLQPCKLRVVEKPSSGTTFKRTSGSQQGHSELQHDRRSSRKGKAPRKDEKKKSKHCIEVENNPCVPEGDIKNVDNAIQSEDTDASFQADLPANASYSTDNGSGEAWSDDQIPVHPPLYASEEQVLKDLDDTDTVLISHGRRAATDSWVLLRNNESPISTSSGTDTPSPMTRSLTAPVILRLMDSPTDIPIISLPTNGSQQTNTAHPSYQVHSNTQQPSGSQFGRFDTLQLPLGPQQGGQGSPDDSGDGSMQSGSEMNAPRFTCVYNGTPRAEYGNDCHTKHRYVSQLKRHHERHDFFYCGKCYSLFAAKRDLEVHEAQDSCQTVCISTSGHSPGVPRTLECRRHRPTQDEQYQWLRLLALGHISNNLAAVSVDIAVADDPADAPMDISSVEGSHQSHDELYEPSGAPISMNSSYQLQSEHSTTDFIENAREILQLASTLSPRMAHLSLQDQATIRSAVAHLSVIKSQLREVGRSAALEDRTATGILPDAYVAEMETYPTRRAQDGSSDRIERLGQFGHSHHLPFPPFGMAPTSVSHAQAQGIIFQAPQGHDSGNTNLAGDHFPNQSSWTAEPEFCQDI